METHGGFDCYVSQKNYDEWIRRRGIRKPVPPNYICLPLKLDYQAANAYCREFFLSELATIGTDTERDLVTDIIGQDEIWFGLQTRDNCRWSFVCEDDSCACTNTESAFRCIDCWGYQKYEYTKYRPRCVGPSEGGEPCAYYKGASGEAENDIPCDTPMPFCCNLPNLNNFL